MAARSGSGSLLRSLTTCGPSSDDSGGALGGRRGLISCLQSHGCRVKRSPLVSENELPQAIQKLIIGFYEEAFNRLPCDAMPDLHRLLTTDGGSSCLGLLDPVSNIILNTIALLPEAAQEEAHQQTSSPPPAKRRRRRSKRQEFLTDNNPDLGFPKASPWLQAAYRSYGSLLAFLRAYFGCINDRQASSYLYTAKADLLLAVMLIQHDLYVCTIEEGAFDPESDRTQAALEYAATMARHPSPTILAQLMSIRLDAADLSLFMTIFCSDDDAAPLTLTVDHVWATHRTLHMIIRPKCCAKIIPIKGGMVFSVSTMLGCCKRKEPPSTMEEGVTTTTTTFSWGRVGTPISSLHSGLLHCKLKKCLETADEQKQYLKKTPCSRRDASCEYLQSLGMFLNAIIHNLYIKAIKLLPAPSGPLMRSILKAGHCYGCMDPLSNIIVNSIWYDTCVCKLSVSARTKMAAYTDILDPLYLLRAQLHSLKGLTKLTAFTDPRFSVPDCGALELLCSAKCDIANTLERKSEKNPFQKAAEAAGHPQPLGLGALHQQLMLMPDARSELRSFITEALTNDNVLRIDDMALCISALWNSSNTSEPQAVRPPQLSQVALRAVSSKISGYEEQRSELRPKIQQLLKEYMTKLFLGPGLEYKLETILGVEEREIGSPRSRETQYNVNFTATNDLKRHRTLFFAEFWRSSHGPRPDYCCPLPFAYAGRCYSDVYTARKIVYPDDAKYIQDDITHPGTRSVDYILLEMDLVYFSPKLDVELVKKLNMLPSEEEKNMKWKKCVRRRNLEISKLQVPIIQCTYFPHAPAHWFPHFVSQPFSLPPTGRMDMEDCVFSCRTWVEKKKHVLIIKWLFGRTWEMKL